MKYMFLILFLVGCEYSLDKPITKKEFINKKNKMLKCNPITLTAHKVLIQSCMLSGKSQTYCTNFAKAEQYEKLLNKECGNKEKQAPIKETLPSSNQKVRRSI